MKTQIYRELVRSLIMSHPTFCCPVSKEILDYRKAELIEYKAGETVRSDVVSHSGIQAMKKSGMWEKLNCKINNEMEN